METAAIMRMKELVQKLDRAAKAYYQQDTEIISNREYDQMYDELQALEKETGTVLANSPTISVGYEAVDQLPKEEHESPMLSLDKTKDREVLREFIGEHKNASVMEAGRTDDRSYLREWRTCQSSYTWKRCDRRGCHQ